MNAARPQDAEKEEYVKLGEEQWPKGGGRRVWVGGGLPEVFSSFACCFVVFGGATYCPSKDWRVAGPSLVRRAPVGLVPMVSLMCILRLTLEKKNRKSMECARW